MAKRKTTSRVAVQAEGDIATGGDIVGGNKQVTHIYHIYGAATGAPAADSPVRPEDDVRLERPKAVELVGREALVSEVCRALRPKTQARRVVVLYGPPGVGKTAIASEAVHRFLDEKQRGLKTRFDAILWHDVDPDAGEQQADQALEALMGQLRRRLHLPLEVSASQPDRQEVRLVEEFNSRDYRLLLVLDELRDAVAPRLMRFVNRLRGAVSVLITRARDWEPDDGRLQHFWVRGLGVAEAKTCLQRSAPRRRLTDDELKQIRHKTAGNLLALGYLARELQRNPQADLDALLEAITDPEGSIAQKIAERTYLSLSSDLGRDLWKALTVFEGSAHRHTLTILAGRDPDRPADRTQVGKAIKELVEQDILLEDRLPQRYWLYDPARKFMTHVLEQAGEYDEWEQRRVAYYVGLRRRADHQHDTAGWTILTDFNPDPGAPLDYSEELITLTHVVDYCLEAGRPAGYWVNAARLLDNFRAVFFMGGYWKQRLEFCEAVRRRAEADGRTDLAGQVKRLLAWMYCFSDDYPAAQRLAGEALQTARAGIDAGPARAVEWVVHLQTYYKALNTLGQVALRQGQQAILLSREAAETPALPALDYLAGARGHFDRARAYFQRAEKFVEGLFPPEALIVQFHQAEVDYYDRREPEGALDQPYQLQHLEKSRGAFRGILQAAEERRHRRLAENARYYLGKTLRRLGFAQALKDRRQRAAFDEGRSLLEAAWRAVGDQDRVLRARIGFALGQWHESEARLAAGPAAREAALEAARRHVQEASTELGGWGMKLESRDAAAFLNRRCTPAAMEEQRPAPMR